MFDDPQNEGFTPIVATDFPIGWEAKVAGVDCPVIGYHSKYTVIISYRGKECAAASSLMGAPPAPGTFVASPKAEKIALKAAQLGFEF